MQFNKPTSPSPGCLRCLDERGATDWRGAAVKQLLKEFSSAFTLPHAIFSS